MDNLTEAIQYLNEQLDKIAIKSIPIEEWLNPKDTEIDRIIKGGFGMIGDFKEMGKECYLVINNDGTLMKLPKLKWYWKLYLHILNYFQGGVHMDTIKSLTAKHG